MNKYKVFQSYYNKNQLSSLEKNCIPFFNKKASPLLESQILVDILKNGYHKHSEWCGLISWKYSKKVQSSGFRSLDKIINMADKFDVVAPRAESYLFYPKIAREHYLLNIHMDIKEPLLRIIYELQKKNLLKNEIPCLTSKQNNIYCNYWIAKNNFFESFVEKCLIPSIEIIKNNSTIGDLCLSDANYGRTPPASFTEQTGFDYYPLAPFVLERMINVYISSEAAKVLYIL